MKFFTILDRIDRMNKLVKEARTGSPDEFATRLGVSRTSLYELLDELRSRGAPIGYSKSVKTFLYTEPFDITITCILRPLSDKDKKDLSGGAWLMADFGCGISAFGCGTSDNGR